MDISTLEKYLHDNIPLSKAMGIKVSEASAERLSLSAPLDLNINHAYTAFGGSVSATAILSAFLLLELNIKREGISAKLVIQKNTVEYKKPVTGNFSATACFDNDDDWQKFKKIFAQKSKARIKLYSTLYCDDNVVGEFEGWFVAMK